MNTDFGLNWNDYGARFYDPAMARWLCKDMVSEKAPSLTPYRYAFNNPVRIVDPNGLYEEDGHYWTVYLAATLTGFSNSSAWNIAYAAQLPDDARDEYGDMRYETNTWMDLDHQKSMHALTGGHPPSERDLSANWARHSTSLSDLGTNLHRLGDSYAHSASEFAMYPHGVGHALTDEGGHWPDKIKNRPGLYLQYVKRLANVLSQSGEGGIDMFTFNYIAKSGLDTDGNSAILETEVSIRQGISVFATSGNQTYNIRKYLADRRDNYHNLKGATVTTATVDVYTKNKDGSWSVSKNQERTIVFFNE